MILFLKSPMPFKRWQNSSIIAWVVLIAMCAVAAAGNWGAGAFSPDSWAYFELSQTIGKDFYRIEHLRSFWTNEYSAAFPPLWPFLIFVANTLINLGPDTAIALNLVILILIAIVADSISKSAFKVHGPGVLMAIILLFHFGFFSEIVAGRSIPLFVLLGLTSLRLMIVEESAPTIGRFAALGATLAAMFMTRFDGALWVIVLLPFILMLKPKARDLLAFGTTYAAGISPWVVYSLIHFAVPFVSDNSWVASALDPKADVTDFPPAQGPTITDNPAFAIETTLGRIPDLLVAVAKSPGQIGLAVFATLLVIFLFSSPWRRFYFADLYRRRTLPFIGVGLAIASAIPSYLLTGYFDSRYFSFGFAFVVFLILVGIWTNNYFPKFGNTLALIASIVGAAIALFAAPGRISKAQIDLPLESQLASCLGIDPDHSPLVAADATQGARLTALYDVRTAFLPSNFVRGASDSAMQEAYLNAYQVEYAIDPSGEVARIFGDQRLSPVQGCGPDIFRILPLEQLAARG
ncbi:hypothetical protein [Aurantiacibacter luteus]|uniref:hypothetical protein n=1 Tax=Aurantiacibacter luteus TaxID=1581420 RepID=UPI000B25C683|nr:hypothetical protein [Aurantiacibacter luteus]